MITPGKYETRDKIGAVVHFTTETTAVGEYQGEFALWELESGLRWSDQEDGADLIRRTAPLPIDFAAQFQDHGDCVAALKALEGLVLFGSWVSRGPNHFSRKRLNGRGGIYVGLYDDSFWVKVTCHDVELTFSRPYATPNAAMSAADAALDKLPHVRRG